MSAASRIPRTEAASWRARSAWRDGVVSPVSAYDDADAGRLIDSARPEQAAQSSPGLGALGGESRQVAGELCGPIRHAHFLPADDDAPHLLGDGGTELAPLGGELERAVTEVD